MHSVFAAVHAESGFTHIANVKDPIPSYTVPESFAYVYWDVPFNVMAESTVLLPEAFADETSNHGDDTKRAHVTAATISLDMALDTRERTGRDVVVKVVVVVGSAVVVAD